MNKKILLSSLLLFLLPLMVSAECADNDYGCKIKERLQSDTSESSTNSLLAACDESDLNCRISALEAENTDLKAQLATNSDDINFIYEVLDFIICDLFDLCEEEIVCSQPTDCPQPAVVEELYCNNDNLWTKNYEAVCNNPGTVESFCGINIVDVEKEVCEYGCEDAACLPPPSKGIVIFRTNIENGDYANKIKNAWIALDRDNDKVLEPYGIRARSSWHNTRCSATTYCEDDNTRPCILVKTPTDDKVIDYTSSDTVVVCDKLNNKQVFYKKDDSDADDAELSNNPTEPYSSNNQETLGESTSNQLTDAVLLVTFDKSAVDDSSKENNDGTEFGNVVIKTTNKAIGSGSAYFDPEDGTTDYVRFPRTETNANMQSFSAGCWTDFSKDNAVPFDTNTVIERFNGNNDMNGDFFLQAKPDLEGLYLYFRGNGPSDAKNAKYEDANIMADNTWKLFGFTCSKTGNILSCNVIVNYTAGDVVTTNSNEINHFGDICIGASCKQVDVGSENEFGFKGSLDNCFVVDKALTFGGPGTDWYNIWKEGADNLDSNPWKTLPDFPHDMANHIAEFADDRFFAGAGGAQGTHNGKFYEFDFQTNQWIQKSNPSDIYDRASVSYNDKIYAFGGVEHGGPLSISHQYNPDTNVWQTITSMPITRVGPRNGDVVGNEAFVMGGGTKFGPQSGATINYAYNFNTNSWQQKADMPRGRLGHATVALNGKIYVIGGTEGTGGAPYIDEIDVYTPATNSWTTLPVTLPKLLSGMVALPINNKIYIFGGGNNIDGVGNTVFQFDPQTNTFTEKTPMPSAQSEFAGAVKDGVAYLVGGRGGEVSGTFYSYDPALD